MRLVVCVRDVYHPHDLQPPANGDEQPEGFRMPGSAEERAVELAVRLRGQHHGIVTLLSVAPPEVEEVLDLYAGLGAEALIRVWDPCLAGTDAGAVGLLLARAVEQLGADLVLCGDRALGGDASGLTGPALAEQLGWPFVGGIGTIEVREERLTLYRLIGRGDQLVLECPLPAVIAVSPDAPAPCYPAFARICRARREVWDLPALNLSPEAVRPADRVEVTGWAAARPRPKKLFTPPSTASAADRLRMVMGGGKARKPQDNLVEAPPEKAAEQILQFLRQEKII